MSSAADAMSKVAKTAINEANRIRQQPGDFISGEYPLSPALVQVIFATKTDDALVQTGFGCRNRAHTANSFWTKPH
jgi:hypothetical protein